MKYSYVFWGRLCPHNPPTESGDRVQTRLIFTVLMVWWPWKLDRGHQSLISSLYYPIDTRIHHLVQEIGCRQAFSGQNLSYKVLVWPWKWRQVHQDLTISSPCLSSVSVQVWPKSTIRSSDSLQTRLIFTIFIVWWPLKLGQGHENLTSSFNYPSGTLH